MATNKKNLTDSIPSGPNILMPPTQIPDARRVTYSQLRTAHPQFCSELWTLLSSGAFCSVRVNWYTCFVRRNADPQLCSDLWTLLWPGVFCSVRVNWYRMLVPKGKNCSNYAEHFRHSHTKFSRPAEQAPVILPLLGYSESVMCECGDDELLLLHILLLHILLLHILLLHILLLHILLLHILLLHILLLHILLLHILLRIPLLSGGC